MDQTMPLETASERPPGFDLAAHWKSSTDQLREGRSRYLATFRMEPRAAERLAMWRGPSRPGPRASTRKDGWVTREMEFDDEEQACFVALGLGPRVDILAPESLRDRVALDLELLVKRRQGSVTKRTRGPVDPETKKGPGLRNWLLFRDPRAPKPEPVTTTPQPPPPLDFLPNDFHTHRERHIRPH